VICPLEEAAGQAGGMELNGLVAAAEAQLMLKVQKVILRAIAAKLRWWKAAEIIGVSDRGMRRWRERYQELGFGGFFDSRKRSSSWRRGSFRSGSLIPRSGILPRSWWRSMGSG
jgi:hypothetical protein